MVRWIAMMLLSGCVVAQVPDAPAKGQTSAVQTPAVDQMPAEKPHAPAPVKTGFPFDEFKEFSAIMVGSLLPTDDREGRIYRSGNMLRTEGPEGRGYILTDLKTFETYGVTKLGCMHDQHPYFRAFPFSVARKGRKIERVSGGKETVDGHECQIEDVTVSSPDLIKPMQLRFWEAQDLKGFPIKVEVLSGNVHSVIEYKEVVLGPQEASLFVHPKPCNAELPQRGAKVVTAPPTSKTPRSTPPASGSQE